jgi:peptidoglycan/xylan/chitin deacetylase (PgdA/CDA1 family)
VAQRKKFSWPNGAKAAVSLSFDDARPSQLDVGLLILVPYGLKGTFYVSPNAMLERWAGWRKAADLGHEIGNHTFTHPCSGNFPWSRTNALEDYTLEQMETDILKAQDLIRQTTGVSPTSFAYPCGQTFVGRGEGARSYIPLIARLFRAGRAAFSECTNHPEVCDLANLASVGCDGFNLDQFIIHLDAALRDGGWIIYCGHDVGESSARQTTSAKALEAFCRELVGRRHEIWTAPVTVVADWIRAARA